MVNTHRLLRVADAATTGAPTLALHHRHAAHGLGSGDPLLFVHVFAFQAEPFRPGGFAWAEVDSDTGNIGEIQTAITDHPLDRDASYASAARFGEALVAHLDAPHLGRIDDAGHPVPPAERGPLPSVLPRVVIANPQVADALRTLGRRFAGLPVPEDADETTRRRVALLRRTGQWLRELHEHYQRAGQGQVVDVLSQLSELYVVPLPHREQGHLAAVVAAIEAGTTAAWDAESVAVGPLPDVEVQNALWSTHTEMRAASRRGEMVVVETLSRLLQDRYAELARTTASAVTDGLRLLDSVGEESRFADLRRCEDLRAYAASAAFLHGPYAGTRAAVQPVTANEARLSLLESAAEVHELRKLLTEPLLRCMHWASGGIVEGRRVGSSSQRIPTGGTTPTGRMQMTTVVDVVVEVLERITPPPLGSRLVWHGADNLQTAGEVLAVDGRRVCIRVAGSGTREVGRPALDGRHDVWVAARTPFTAGRRPLRRDELPATHRSSQPSTPADAEVTRTEVDAILASRVVADGKDYA